MKKLVINTIFVAGCACSFYLFYMAAAGVDKIFYDTIKIKK